MNRRSFVVTAALALAGCGQQKRAPEDYFYRLHLTPPTRPLSPPPLDGALSVKRFSADGVIRERSVAYASSDSPHLLHRYNYHLWADSPERMLQEEAVDYLRAAGLANKVFTPEIRANAEFVLSGKIRKLEQIRGPSPRVEVSLELVLQRERDGELRAYGDYARTELAQGESVASAVDAMSLALTRVFEEFVRDVAAR